MAKRSPSKHEDKFTRLWTLLRGPKLVPEHRFHPVRKWRFDFAYPQKMIAIECEGGHWTGGRHTRGSGFAKDCEKYSAAAELGWLIFRLTGPMITSEWVERIIARCK